MTTIEPGEDAPRPKTPMPPLDARAPRPPVVRLRRNVVAGLVMGGASLVGGALAWALVVQPELRTRARDAAAEAPAAEAQGRARPSERVTEAPATYAQLDRLPEPRRLGPDAPVRSDTPPAPRVSSRPIPVRRGGPVNDPATASNLFFAAAPQVSATRAPRVTSDADAAPPDEPTRPRQRGEAGAVYNPNTLAAPVSPFEVKAGAVIPAVLLTAIDTARSGPVVAAVTEPVFDTVTGRHLVIPQGSRLIGRHEGESRYGDRRAFVVWDRLLLPNGKSLVLTGAPGVDAQGAVGLVGQVDRRLGPLTLATLFAGAITALGQAARDDDGQGTGGLLGDAGDAAAIEAAQVGGRLIDRELEVRPSIRLQAGARVRALVTRDLVLEPFRP